MDVEISLLIHKLLLSLGFLDSLTLADKIIGTKGIKHGKLVMTDIE